MQNPPPPSVPSPVPGLSGLTVIARGGYSTVYKARQDSVGREVALKIDTRSLDDERDRRRFLREAEAAGRMSGHPNVVNVYDAGVTGDNHPYLVMELCSGGSYATRLKTRGPLPPAEVRDVGVKIADALEAAHNAGILHRDVKPGNILVNAYGVPGLADFGLAALPDPSRELSVTIEALTPAYAPPEVFRMERPTAAGDVYALAATLYALLSGRPPRWPITGAPSLATMIRLHDEPLTDLPGVPADFTNVLRRGMAADAVERYPSAAAFRDALASISLDPDTVVGPTSAPRSRSLPPAPVASQPPPGGPAAALGGPPPPPAGLNGYPPAGANNDPPKKPSGRPVLIASVTALVTLLLLGGVAVGAFLLIREPASTQAGERAPSPSPSPAPSPTVGDIVPSLPIPTASGGDYAGGLFGDCPLETVGSAGGVEVMCPGKAECWAGITNIGGNLSAHKLSCNRKHTWETFLVGELPSSVKSAGYDEVAGNAVVKTLCGSSALTIALEGKPTAGWSTQVLPPSESDLARGKREFRCVAGKGLDQLSSPQFADG